MNTEHNGASRRPWPWYVGAIAVATVVLAFAPVHAVAIESALDNSRFEVHNVAGLFGVGMLFGQITSAIGVVVAALWLMAPLAPRAKTAVRVALSLGVASFGLTGAVLDGFW